LVEGENGDLTDSHSILNGWKNYFCQLLNAHGVNDVRQIEMHTAEPLAPEPSPSEAEIAIEELKWYKSPGIYQVPAELIQTGGKTLCSRSTNLLIVSGIKNFQSSGRNLLLYLFIRRVVNLIAVIAGEYYRYLVHIKLYPAFF
jgi:hypothetical protein